MTALPKKFSHMRRPTLLIRAARFGLRDYDRCRALRRLLGLSRPGAPGSARVLDQLLAREAEMNAARRDGQAGYRASRHVDLLIAMLAEARLIGAHAPAPEAAQLNASGISDLRRATYSFSAPSTSGASAGCW